MSKWRLFSSIFQIVVGIAAIIAYIVIAASGELLGNGLSHYCLPLPLW